MNEILGSLLRHALTAIGGYLVAKGVVTADQTTPVINELVSVIPGIVLYIAGQLFSFVKLAKTKEIKEENQDLKSETRRLQSQVNAVNLAR